jgi:hypothetical protein
LNSESQNSRNFKAFQVNPLDPILLVYQVVELEVIQLEKFINAFEAMTLSLMKEHQVVTKEKANAILGW